MGLDDLSGEWEETNVQVSGTCNTFKRDGDLHTYLIESCATVYDDVAAAEEAYADALDRSLNLMGDQLDVSPNIGDEAAVVREGPREGMRNETVLRLLIRDSNATGKIDYTDEAEFGAEDTDELQSITVEEVTDFGARMHDGWRE